MPYTALDADIVLPDRNASSFAGVTTRNNIVGLRRDRHVGASWTGTQYAGTRPHSTHPYAWWGTAFFAHVYPGATTLRVTVHVTGSVADGKVRLSCGGRVSAESTVTAGTTEFISLSVALPDVGSRQRIRAAIEWQSGIGASAGTVTVLSWQGINATIEASGASPAVPGTGVWSARHQCMIAASASAAEKDQWARGYYYLGASVTAATGGDTRVTKIWPAVDGMSGIDSSSAHDANVYNLTQFVLHGYTVDVTGDGARVPTAAESNYYTGQDIYAADIYALHRLAAEVYETRVHVAMLAGVPGNAGNSQAFGRDNGLVCDALIEARADTVALEFGALAAPLSAGDAAVQWSIDASGRGGASGSYVTSHTMRLDPESTAIGRGMRAGVSAQGTLPALGASIPTWGGRDLAHCAPGDSDIYRMQLVSSRLNLTGESWVVGDSYRVSGRVTVAPVVMLGGYVAEVISTGGR